MKVKVFMEFVNAWGDVIESVEIARFRCMNHLAEKFIEMAKDEEDEITRIRVEEI